MNGHVLVVVSHCHPAFVLCAVWLCSQQVHFWQEVIRQIVQVAMDAKLLMTVYFEQHLEEPLQSLKEEWNLKTLPLVT